jgi:glycosyltransferase involved in cell wall biosynthesis
VKVLVVIDSLGLGGAENLLTVLAGAAPAAGIELHVASLTPPSMGRLALQPAMTEAGLTTSFLDIPHLRHPSGVWRIARELKLRNADVAHAHLGYSAILSPLAALATGRGSVSTLHHVPEDLPPRERLKERMAVEFSGRLGTLVFVSDASRREFAARYPDRQSWVTVHNGVDLRRFSPGPASLPPELGIPDRVPVVTIVAALRPPKGHAVALAAWERVLQRFPEARLLIVGEGVERDRLETSARMAGMSDHVVFAGIRQDIPELLRASTVVLLPSLTEALPTALIEAAACARPTVATSVGGTSEVVEHGMTGLLVAPADPSALATALVRLLSDEAMRTDMGSRARHLAETRFDADRWAHRLREIYEQSTSRGPSRAGVGSRKTSPALRDGQRPSSGGE